MPHHFEFDREHRLLLGCIEGDLQDADALAYDEGYRHYVAKLDPSAGLTDFSGITAFSASGNVIRSAARTPPPYKTPIPWFFVAPTDMLFGMARMYQIISSDTRPRLQVVRSREEVFATLGIENPKFERVRPSTGF
jgi:hypothetical protein